MVACMTGIVLALGSGGARGIAHLGILRVLEREGIPVRAVIGSSIGAQIGALYASGMSLQQLIRLACDVDWKTTIRLFLPEFGRSGLITDKGIREFLEPHLGHLDIEDMNIGFAAIAADLISGEEVLIRHGNLLEAVRASIAVPGLLKPSRVDGQWLVDGGLVNPVPFDRARELFGGPVIGVAVHPGATRFEKPEEEGKDWRDHLEELIRQSVERRWPTLQRLLDEWGREEEEEAWPGMAVGGIYNRAMDISRAQLMRLREKISPPDMLIVPPVQGIGMLEFYRGEEALKAGERSAEQLLPKIRTLL